MTKLLLRLFAPNKETVSPAVYRLRCGQLSGAVGMILNIILCLGKLIVGAATHSISVMADAINNLSDALSSVISLAGFHMAAKKPDREHPFGHGRMEYISGLFVSVLILFVGFQFIKSSVERIISPEPVVFSWQSLVILAVTMAAKLWLGLFNRKVGTEIQSPVLMAAMQDSINDVFTTGVVILGMITAQFTTIPIDGIVGVVVAVFILWSGCGLAKDALSPLLGERADPEIAQKIEQLVTSYDGILGVHDLIVHNYGAEHVFASVHAEVASDADILEIHETIDAIEQQAKKTLQILLVIHMDPIEINNERVQTVRRETEQILHNIDASLTMHDFRMVDGEKRINLIFDVVVDHDFQPAALRQEIRRQLKEIDARYEPVIVFDSVM